MVLHLNTSTKKTFSIFATDHKEDFSISAEWHFSATSHRKGACDDLERTMK